MIATLLGCSPDSPITPTEQPLRVARAATRDADGIEAVQRAPVAVAARANIRDAQAADPWAAVLVDQSQSMQGFAPIVPTLVDALDRAIASAPAFQERHGGAIRWFGVGERITTLPGSTVLGDASTYAARRADLIAALSAGETEGATLTILVTDGQLSPQGSLDRECLETTRPDLSGLTGAVGQHLARGERVWLWIERVAFSGKIYLNCSKLSAAKQANTKFEIKCTKSKECHSSHQGDRTIVALVVAGPGREAEGSQVIRTLLGERPQSRVIALWRDDPGRPSVRVESSGWGALEKRTSHGPETDLRVICHEPSPGERMLRALRVTVRSDGGKPPVPGDGLWSLGSSSITLHHDGSDTRSLRVYEMPPGLGVDEESLRSAPRIQGSCDRAFERLVQYWKAKGGARSACDGVGSPCREFLALCDCGLPNVRPAATIKVSATTERQVERVLKSLGEAGMIADRGKWLEQLDRIAGLDGLLFGIAGFEEARSPVGPEVDPAVSVKINVEPSPPTGDSENQRNS